MPVSLLRSDDICASRKLFCRQCVCVCVRACVCARACMCDAVVGYYCASMSLQRHQRPERQSVIQAADKQTNIESLMKTDTVTPPPLLWRIHYCFICYKNVWAFQRGNVCWLYSVALSSRTTSKVSEFRLKKPTRVDMCYDTQRVHVCVCPFFPVKLLVRLSVTAAVEPEPLVLKLLNRR